MHELIIVSLVFASGILSSGYLTISPQNCVVLDTWVNYSMNCSSSFGNKAISWHFIPLQTSNNITIATGNIVGSAYQQLYWIDQPTGSASNLFIRRLLNLTAGTYICADNETSANAQLVVYSVLSSSSNLSEYAGDGDVIAVGLSFKYFANPVFFPEIKGYYDSYGIYLTYNTSSTSQIEGSMTTVNATYTTSVTCSDEISRIYFVTSWRLQPSKLLPQAAANDGMSITYQQPQFFLNISCIPTAEKMRVTGSFLYANVVYAGGVVTCQAKTNPPSNFTWKDNMYGNSSHGPALTVWHNGVYVCTASNFYKGTWHSASIQVNLTVPYIRILVDPLYGPIAGGTQVNISVEGDWSGPGYNLPSVSGLSNIYIGDNLRATNISIDRFKFRLTFLTPATTEASIGRSQLIVVEFLPGPFNFSTDKMFTYQSDPQILSIYPNQFPVTGGTLLIVTGRNLGSVARPLIQVKIVITRANDTKPTSNTGTENCDLQPGDESKMVCPMPVISIPDDFLQILNANYTGSNRRKKRQTASQKNLLIARETILSRRKRFTNAMSVYGPNGKDKVDIYIGFLLDGQRNYENINNVLPTTQIFFYSPPQIESTNEVINFYSSKDQMIYIKGKYMKRGCEQSNYLVLVGSDVCVNVDLTDNQLSCLPPTKQPQITANDTLYCPKLLSVDVKIGYVKYHYSCLRYSSSTKYGSFGLLFLLSFSLVVLIIV